jgi:hypothetical protein
MRYVALMAVVVATLSVSAIPALAQSGKFRSKGVGAVDPDTAPLAPADRVAARGPKIWQSVRRQIVGNPALWERRSLVIVDDEGNRQMTIRIALPMG